MQARCSHCLSLYHLSAVVFQIWCPLEAANMSPFIAAPFCLERHFVISWNNVIRFHSPRALSQWTQLTSWSTRILPLSGKTVPPILFLSILQKDVAWFPFSPVFQTLNVIPYEPRAAHWKQWPPMSSLAEKWDDITNLRVGRPSHARAKVAGLRKCPIWQSGSLRYGWRSLEGR